MVPPKSDPKWVKFIGNIGSLKVNDLSTRMMINRLKMRVAFDTSEAVRKQSISDAYDFFAKNEASLKEDIKQIFG
jgi:hypothetical protein